MKKIFVTTSWDDGHKLDLKLAQLLKKYKIKGTFYIAPQNREFTKNNLLNRNDILYLSKEYEIGAHTQTHQNLSKISLNQADWEIKKSKQYLENIVSNKIISFSYPYGAYNNEVSNLVKKSGYSLARTTKKYTYLKSIDNYQMPTSLECHRISLLNSFSEIKSIYNLADHNLLQTIKFLDWEYIARAMFDEIYKNGGIFHLWGHSWVIDKWSEWDKLERVLNYISKRAEVSYVTNNHIIKTT